MNDASDVKLHFLDYWRIIKVRAGLIALAFVLVIMTAGVVVWFMPREYYSKVTVEVKPDRSGAIDVFSNSSRAATDPTFVSTQFNNLQKTEILYPVISALKLTEKWAVDGRPLTPQIAKEKLLRMMSLKEVRNTALIEIGIYSTDKEEAADIANMIAVIYRDSRLKEVQVSAERGLALVKEGIESQSKRVVESAGEMNAIRARDAITDPDPDNPNTQFGTTDRNLVALEQQVNEQGLVVTRTRGQLEQITKLKPEELKEALRTFNMDDQGVIKMVNSLLEAQTDETKYSNSGLGENHPRIVSLRALQESYANQLSKSLSAVRLNLASKLAVEESTLQVLQEKFNTAREAQIKDKEKASAYAKAKGEALQEKRIFEAAKIKFQTESFDSKLYFEPAHIREKAEPSLYPSKPKVPAYMAVAVILGLGVGVGLAFFIEYLDTSVKTLDDVEKFLGVPVLAVVLKDAARLITSRGDTPDAEAYRILRANMEFNKPDRNSNTITLVSGGPGEGKSTTLNNMAYTCAQGGYNVLVVDADLRRPTQHTFFDIPNQFGLTDYLTGKATIDEITKPSKIDNLSFIPSGQLPEEAVGILNSQRMVELIAQVKSQYDLVFFDAPPILGVSDGSVLASECDITIMVVQHRRFPRAMLEHVKKAVLHCGGTLIGVVLNNVDPRHDNGYSYYNSYNDYYSPRPTKEEASRRASDDLATTSAASSPKRPRSISNREDY
ncbi:MAG: ywqD 2 [Chthoniobacteraceae bacterium]|nr:ywqD 2 [Chthoniobacteraceae bacterium]